MISQEKAEQSAQNWLNAWNRHDLDSIMEHYAENILFISPFVVKLVSSPGGMVQGKAALREYFGKGLEKFPDLEFKLIHVLVGVRSFTIFYKSVNNLLAAEVMEFNHEDKVSRVLAHYLPE